TGCAETVGKAEHMRCPYHNASAALPILRVTAQDRNPVQFPNLHNRQIYAQLAPCFQPISRGVSGDKPMHETSEQEAVISALRGALSPFHYQWLCACAIYPGLRFPLTVWLGARLAEREGREPPDADAHLPLIRLPWFREGAIPDAMRLRLLRDL